MEGEGDRGEGSFVGGVEWRVKGVGWVSVGEGLDGEGVRVSVGVGWMRKGVGVRVSLGEWWMRKGKGVRVSVGEG